jgi:hypothetical protein
MDDILPTLIGFVIVGSAALLILLALTRGWHRQRSDGADSVAQTPRPGPVREQVGESPVAEPDEHWEVAVADRHDAGDRPRVSGERFGARTSVYLIYVAVGLYIIGLIELIRGHDTIRQSIEADKVDWSVTRVNGEILAHTLGAAMFSVLVVVIWLWLADKLETRGPWTRVAVSVFAVLAALGVLPMIWDSAWPTGVKTANGFAAIAGVGAAALLWTSQSRVGGRQLRGHM